MLQLDDLDAFAAEFTGERPNLENYFMVASEDKLAKLYGDTVNKGDLCTMVVVIPSHDANIPDEDNRRFRDNLFFVFLKKTDQTAGNKEELRVFGLCQAEALAMVRKIIDLHQNFGENCIFRDIDLNSVRVDPLQDYLSANGYQLEFATKTKF